MSTKKLNNIYSYIYVCICKNNIRKINFNFFRVFIFLLCLTGIMLFANSEWVPSPDGGEIPVEGEGEFPPVEGEVEPIAVTIPDPILERLILNTLRLSVTPILSTDLARITVLDGDVDKITGIASLTGLEYCINLVAIRISNGTIKDLTPLSNLSSLEQITLDYHQILDISPLKNLNNLEWLSLIGNQISVLSPLEELQRLSVLYLDSNQINDNNIQILASLTDLEILGLEHNLISNLSPLSNLSKLMALYLSSNNITDIKSLGALTNLMILHLAENNISNADILANMTELTELNLNDNLIENIEFIKNNKILVNLYLAGNNINALKSEDGASYFSDIEALEVLNLSENQIIDIDPLNELKELNGLYLNHNTIISIMALNEMNNLYNLELSNNSITDINSLTELNNLQELHLSNNQIADISVFSTSMENLAYLDLSSNQITDLAPLGERGWFDTLILCNNPATDFRPLSSIAELGSLYLLAHDCKLDVTQLPFFFYDLNENGIWESLDDSTGNGVSDTFEDFNGNGLPDGFEDFNKNGTPDAFEDFNGDERPDAFWLDYNQNGISDVFEFGRLQDVFTDFGGNPLPDALEDFNGNNIPDAFEDFSGNAIPDAFEDFNGDSFSDAFQDYNGSGIPDAFERFSESTIPDAFLMNYNDNTKPDVFEYGYFQIIFTDFDGNGMPDALQFRDTEGMPFIFRDYDGDEKPDAYIDASGNGKPDAFEDLNGNGTPEGFDDYDDNGIPNLGQNTVLQVGRFTQYNETSVALSATAVPGFALSGPWSGLGKLDLASQSDGTAASANYWYGVSVGQKISGALSEEPGVPEMIALGIGQSHPPRVDVTGEPGGFVVAFEDGSYQFYNNKQAISPLGFGKLPPQYTTILDVAGIGQGCVAFLVTNESDVQELVIIKRVFDELGFYGPPLEEPVAVHSLPDIGLIKAMAGLKQDALLLLTDTELLILDFPQKEDSPLRYFPLDEAGGVVLRSLDVAVDKEQHILSLVEMEGQSEPKVLCLQDFVLMHRWTVLDLQDSQWNETIINNKNMLALATSFAPDAGANDIPIRRYEPTVDPPNPGDSRSEIGKSGVTVDTPGTQQTSDGYTWALKGWGSIFNFLRIEVDGPSLEGRYLRWKDNIIEGSGELFLNFPGLPGFPAEGFSIWSGSFRIDVNTGILELLSGIPKLEIPLLGKISFKRLRLLGVGSDQSDCSRTGIVVEEGASGDILAGLGKLKFKHLLLGDFGGNFRITFGMPNLPGLGSLYTSGLLDFEGFDLFELKTTGEKLENNKLHFDSLMLKLKVSPEVLVTASDLNISTSELTFTDGLLDVEDTLKITLKNTHIRVSQPDKAWNTNWGPGFYTASAIVDFPAASEKWEATNLYIGKSGIFFDNVISINLAGFKANIVNLGFSAPYSLSGAFVADSARFETAGATVILKQLQIPLNDFPSIKGAVVAMGANPQTASVRLEAEGDVKLSSNEIAIPRLKVKAPGFDLSFPGGRIAKDSIEIYDAPPVPIFGVQVDLERVSFRKGEFATNYASVGTDAISLSLRDLTIGNNGLGIGGGGFKYFGFGVDVSARSVNDALCLGATLTGIPVFGNGGLDFCIENGNKLRIERAALPNVKLGPVSINNAVFIARNDLLYFTADVGFSSWNFKGAVELESGKLKKVSLDGDFTNMPGGGYILWSVPPIYLNSIGASVYPMEARIQGRVVLCLLTAIQIPIVGTCTLAGLNGQAEFNGSLGYVRADADIQAFAKWNSDTKRWKGIELAAATAIAGNVYLDGKFRGLGAYGSGRMNFFGFIEGTQTGQAYSTGNLDAKLNGSLKIPGGIPIIGGKTFANVEAVLRDGPYFSTRVNIDMPIPPLPYECGWSSIKRCNNVCHWLPWPLDDWCETVCETIRVPKICWRTHVNWGFGITIDSNPPYLHDIRLWKDEQGLQTFDKGYHANTGMTVLTNYQCLARKSLLKDGSISKYADATEAKIIPFDYYPESKSDRIINQNTRQAIFRYDFTEFEGDANISLRFPDGTLYRWDDENIPRFSPDMVFETQMDIGDVAISYYHNVYDDGEQKMKEAGFICNGPYVIEKHEVIGEGGEPTGAFDEIFLPGPLPYGRYEIIVEATEKADQGALDILAANNLPELLYAKVEPLEPLEERRYRISWQVNDEDGNPTAVRLQLVNNTDDPELGVPLGAETVYESGAGKGEYILDMLAPEILGLNIIGPMEVVLSLEDIPVEGNPDTRHYYPIGSVTAVSNPALPSKVNDVVALATDGAVELHWGHAKWSEKKGNQELVGYTVICEEICPKGVTAPPPIVVSTPINQVTYPVDEKGIPKEEGIETAAETSAVISGLTNGRQYRTTIVPCVHETTVNKDGTASSVQLLGQPSKGMVLMPLSSKNNPPRFLSSPGETALFGQTYKYRVRLEDMDGDPVDLKMTSLVPVVGEEGAPENAEEVLGEVLLEPTEMPYEWDLSFIPEMPESNKFVGQWLFTLEAQDVPSGEKAQQEFGVIIAQYSNKIPEPMIDSQPDLMVYAGETFTYQLILSQVPEEFSPLYQLNSGPAGMQVDPITGLVTWNTTFDDVGTYNISIGVLDGRTGLPADTNISGCATCKSISNGFGNIAQEFTLEVLKDILAEYGPVIMVTPGSATVGPEVSSLEFDITNSGIGDLEWTAEIIHGTDWLEVTTLDVGQGLLSVSVAANALFEPRKGMVQIRCITDNFSVRNVSILQQASSALVITPSSIEMPTEGGTASLSVTCPTGICSYSAEVSIGSEWLSAASMDTELQVLCAANNVPSKRFGRITVTPEKGNPVEILVRQDAGNSLSLEATPLQQQAENAGGIVTFSVHTSSYWYAFPDQPWMVLTDGTGSGTGDGNISVSVEGNPGLARTGTITITGSGTTPGTVPVTIMQKGISVDISGKISRPDGVGEAEVLLTASGDSGTAVTDANGTYILAVESGFTGTVTPSKKGHTFEPELRNYDNITTGQVAQNYATYYNIVISGKVRCEDGSAAPDVTLTAGDIATTATTDAAGIYQLVLPCGYSGTITPSKTGYTFTPTSRSYDNLMTNQTDQDYATTCNILISGKISHEDGTAEPDVTLTARMENGNIVGTAATGADGAYILTVPYGYTGTVDASKTGFTFDPAQKSYTELTTNQKDQNYIAKACTGAPEAPQNLVADSLPGVAGRIDLRWDASDGATGYKVYRRLVLTVPASKEDVESLIKEAGDYELLGTATEANYTDESAPEGYDDFTPKCCMYSSFDCMGCINIDENPGCYDVEHLPGALVEYQVVAFNECGDSAPGSSVSASAYKLLTAASVLMLNADMLLFLAVVLLMVLVSKRLKRGFTAEG